MISHLRCVTLLVASIIYSYDFAGLNSIFGEVQMRQARYRIVPAPTIAAADSSKFYGKL